MVGLGVSFHDGASVGSSIATAVSGDGSVIVGDHMNGSHPFIWDAAHGMRDLLDVLTDDYGLGSQIGQLELQHVSGISADGQTITGTGIVRNDVDPDVAWVVVLPEPGSLALLSLGFLAIRLPRRIKSSSGRRARAVEKRKSLPSALILTAFFLAGSISGAVQAQSFKGLGYLSGFNSLGTSDGVSSDGSTVIGSCTSTSNSREGFQWTQSHGHGRTARGVFPGVRCLGRWLCDRRHHHQQGRGPVDSGNWLGQSRPSDWRNNWVNRRAGHFRRRIGCRWIQWFNLGNAGVFAGHRRRE